jgi:hypothetical protein
MVVPRLYMAPVLLQKGSKSLLPTLSTNLRFTAALGPKFRWYYYFPRRRAWKARDFNVLGPS